MEIEVLVVASNDLDGARLLAGPGRVRVHHRDAIVGDCAAIEGRRRSHHVGRRARLREVRGRHTVEGGQRADAAEPKRLRAAQPTRRHQDLPVGVRALSPGFRTEHRIHIIDGGLGAIRGYDRCSGLRGLGTVGVVEGDRDVVTRCHRVQAVAGRTNVTHGQNHLRRRRRSDRHLAVGTPVARMPLRAVPVAASVVVDIDDLAIARLLTDISRRRHRQAVAVDHNGRIQRIEGAAVAVDRQDRRRSDVGRSQRRRLRRRHEHERSQAEPDNRERQPHRERPRGAKEER